MALLRCLSLYCSNSYLSVRWCSAILQVNLQDSNIWSVCVVAIDNVIRSLEQRKDHEQRLWVPSDLLDDFEEKRPEVLVRRRGHEGVGDAL